MATIFDGLFGRTNDATAPAAPAAGGNALDGLFNDPKFQMGLSLLAGSRSANPWQSVTQNMQQFGESSAKRKYTEALATQEQQRAALARDQFEMQKRQMQDWLDFQSGQGRYGAQVPQGPQGGTVQPSGEPQNAPAPLQAQPQMQPPVRGLIGSGLFGGDNPDLDKAATGFGAMPAGLFAQQGGADQRGLPFPQPSAAEFGAAEVDAAQAAPQNVLNPEQRGQSGMPAPPPTNAGLYSDVPVQPQRTSTALASPDGNWSQINANYKAGQGQRENDRITILREELANETNPQNRAALERDLQRMTGKALPAQKGGGVDLRGTYGTSFDDATTAATDTAKMTQTQLSQVLRDGGASKAEGKEFAGQTKSFFKALPRTEEGMLDLERMSSSQLYSVGMVASSLGQKDTAALFADMAGKHEIAQRQAANGRYEFKTMGNQVVRIDATGQTEPQAVFSAKSEPDAMQAAKIANEEAQTELYRARARQVAAGKPENAPALKPWQDAQGKVYNFNPATGDYAPATVGGNQLQGAVKGAGVGAGKGPKPVEQQTPDELRSQVARNKDVLATIDEIRHDPDLGRATGFTGQVQGALARTFGLDKDGKGAGGTKRYDIASKIESVRSNAAIQGVMEAAKAGVSLSPLSDSDVKMIASNVARLDPNMSKEALQESLGKIANVYTRANNATNAELARRSAPSQMGTAPSLPRNDIPVRTPQPANPNRPSLSSIFGN